MEAQTIQRKLKPTVMPRGKSRGRHYEGQHANVQSILHGSRIQPKLRVGQPNDKYEQEADRMAEQVMRMPTPQPRSFSSADHSPPGNNIPHSGTIQRACATCSGEYDTAENENRSVDSTNLCPKCQTREKELIQTKQTTRFIQRQESLSKEEGEALIQAKTNGNVTPEVTPAIGASINSLHGGGQLLSKSERGFFEPRIGADFSNVRVHNDARAASVAQSISARAFTLGNNVVFGAGEYSPGTLAGRSLLAHELVHVVQQGAMSSTIHRAVEVQPLGVASGFRTDLEGSSMSGSTASPQTIPSSSAGCAALSPTPILPSTVDWNADPVLAAISAEPFGSNEQLIARASSDPAVQVATTLIKQAIRAWGCDVLGTDLLPSGTGPTYGTETRQAVRTYQSRAVDSAGAQLDDDAIVGPRTLSSLNVLVSAVPTPAPGPTPGPSPTPGPAPSPAPGPSPAPVPAPGTQCPTNVIFQVLSPRAHIRGSATATPTTLSRGGHAAIKLEAPLFGMRAAVRGRGQLSNVRDWELGFSQTMHNSEREICWRNQHERKDELTNHGGQIIDSLSAGDTPFARRAQVKNAGRLRLLSFDDQPFRTIPINVGTPAAGDCLQSMTWKAAFTTRLIARKKGSGNQPLCALHFADWNLDLAISPGLRAIPGFGCPTTPNVNVVDSSAVATDGAGAGTGPFETQAKGGLVMNTTPEWQRLNPITGPC